MSRRLAALAALVLASAPLGALAPVHAQAPAQKPPAAKPGAKPPAAPAPSTPAAQTPAYSANHLALAREVMLNSGIARSFDSIIPAFSDRIRQGAVTRPEITKDLDTVLASLEPEMELQKQAMIETAARIYASRLSEAELNEIATFFRSPAGKRYVETQPQVLDEMVQAMQTWTQDVSEYIMVRVRAEMAKKGHQLQ
ncbi:MULTISPECIES: DUF2059 domain-containing protein [unclassified Methylobacterium]|uniref:DUF2059 domain-containing protein n=1 Tax=unclassified Methylobacterium TaxID=2615210 RepID=UPI0006F5E157|nr:MULTISPECIES: DUF2059 domain-containing protein [unclassified Methylobacterium]KQO65672.1 hypothetical protein ASF20_07240 [Methylobacterium sp. Leaf88]KQO67683.1 hypothetical protein ASF18_03950 [Methylobacterium sp. Leaf89]KQP72440.1 hypothetical protein ASF41_19265 [Methylobacterium sp. Leaf111]KQT73455.1 hypothetical protein ASG51_08110 [Methylobacterium sp. Leaf465]KQU20997.1 hypothetical protein ASG63_05005 [Methylobacterium sp. Leaf94]